MSKLLLIDGHSILNRAFYGIPVNNFSNSEGLHTNAIYGFLTMMFKYIDEEKPDHIAVAFDVKKPTFRHEMFKEYKGTRKPMLPELKEQVPVMKQVLRAMNITTVEMPGFEADDVLGTLSKIGEENGFDVSVISGDRDLLQLATSKVKICIPKTSKGVTTTSYYYDKDVLEEYKVTPIEFIDYKALLGDTSDNIPGVPGIGKVGASKIISEYHSIENAYEHVDEIKNNKSRTSLKENYDQAVLSKELATINTSVELEIKLSDCEINDLYNEKSYEIIRKLEFKSMYNRFQGIDIYKDSEIKITEVKDLNDIKYAGKEVGLAIFDGEIFAIAVSIDNETYFASTNDFSIDELTNFIKECKTSISIDNIKAYNDYLLASDKDDIFDVGIAAYLLNPTESEYTYDKIANEYLSLTVPSREEIFPKVKKSEPDPYLDIENIKKYTGTKAYINAKVKSVLIKKLKEVEMLSVYNDIEFPLVFALYDMEKAGIMIRKDKLKEYGDNLQIHIDELTKEIYQEAGKEFNINSPKQLGEILFVDMNLPFGKKTKTGYSTSASILEKLEPDYPFVGKVMEYRQLTKLKSTYADGLSNYIDKDGRIRGKFNQTVTATGRISSTEPNLQNIPVRMPLGREIRKLFVPKEGCVFIDADYSQIELRILAHMSEDDNLIEAYRDSKDIHASTASLVFNVPIEDVTPLMRRNAKAVNFGIVYGISSFGLSKDLSISRKEAEAYINDYFKNYPGIKKYLDDSVKFAKENGYAKTLFNRRRPVSELKSGNFMVRQFGERVAMNSPIQGTAADIMKIAMINVYKELKDRNLKSRIVLQVHDELLIETYKDEVEIVKEILSDKMTHAADLKVNLDIDIQTGENWDEAH